MSTTFGVKISEEKIVEVAFRSTSITWLNPLAPLLPNHIKVIPLDNSYQGIYTIGDIKKSINERVM